MKNITYILILILLFSCKTENKEKNNIQSKPENLVQKKEKQIEYKYVIAKSGLNYRKKPKGDLIGKFKFGDKLQIIKNTNIHQYIFDNGYMVKGNWLGVKLNNDTVYTFGGYLSENIKTNSHKSKKRLRYLYFSNGGLIGYFSDGTITGCPRCDLLIESVNTLYTSETTGRTYIVNEKNEIIEEDQSGDVWSPVMPVEINNENGFREWAIINYKEVVGISSIEN